MALVAAEARALDWLETLGDDGRVSGGVGRRLFGVLARQVAGGVAVTWRDAGDGRLAAMAGVYPNPEWPNFAEAWFAVGPAMRPNLRGALTAMAGTLEMVGIEAAPVTVRALIEPRGVAGPRLATWLGFSAAGSVTTGAGTYDSFERVFSCPRS